MFGFCKRLITKARKTETVLVQTKSNQTKLTREEFVETVLEVFNRVVAVDKIDKTDAEYEYLVSELFVQWLARLSGKYPDIFDLRTMSVAVKFDGQTNALIFKPSLAMNVLLTDMNVSL